MNFPTRLWSTTARARPPMGQIELSPIKAVELRASQIPGVVSLAQGIPSFDTPEPIKQYVQQKIAEGACARYSVTPGLPALREAIAEALRADGMSYDPDEEIIVTAGSIEAIAATLLACIEPGDEVLVVSPTYASYLPAIQIAGGVPRYVPLDEDANFDLDPDAIASAVGRRTRALLICNPNNPTGTVFSRSQTLRMLAVAELRNLLVITDEVYKDFVYGDAAIFSAARESSTRHRVIRVFSFSKAYAMTGWRVGFVHGPARHIREILKVHDALVTCAPVVSQYAALAALELGDESIASFRSEFRRRRDHVLTRLDALPHVFDFQKPNASYFVFPRVKDTVPLARDSRRFAEEMLERAHVAVVPGIAFGPTGEAHIRLCYARPAEDIDRAFDRLDDFFAGRTPRVSTTVDLAATAPPERPPWYRLRNQGIALLRRMAGSYLKRTSPRTVVITGSQGKTVFKRTLQELLSTHFRVRTNPLSHNTDVGLALAILDSELDTRTFTAAAGGVARAASAAFFGREHADVLILELGIRQAGDMAAHLEIVRPEIAVVTPLVPSFSTDHEALGVLRQEVATLCRSMETNGRGVLLCRDDPTLAALAEEFPHARFYTQSEATLEDGHWVLHVDDRRFHSNLDLVGSSGLYAATAAIRVALALGMDEAAVERALNATSEIEPQ